MLWNKKYCECISYHKHLTLARSLGQGQGHAYLDCEYRINGDRYIFEHLQSNEAIQADFHCGVALEFSCCRSLLLSMKFVYVSVLMYVLSCMHMCICDWLLLCACKCAIHLCSIFRYWMANILRKNQHRFNHFQSIAIICKLQVPFFLQNSFSFISRSN